MARFGFHFLEYNMKRNAVFPGSFDPFTLGHFSVVEKALPLFDEITIAIGTNSTKTSAFSLDQRLQWIKDVYQNESRVKVKSFAGLTIDFCNENDCRFILRGLRNSIDFEYESNIGHMNYALDGNIETVFMLCNPAFAAINSSIVREIYKNGSDVSQFIPIKMNISL